MKKNINKRNSLSHASASYIVVFVQVIDLSEGRMEDVLEWCELASPVRCTILVCGGDGTVGWLLNTAHKLGPRTDPLVAIFPLGTGKLPICLESQNK